MGGNGHAAPQIVAFPRPGYIGSLKWNRMAMRYDSWRFFDRLDGSDGRGFEDIAFLDGTRLNRTLAGGLQHHPSSGSRTSFNDGFLSDVHDAFNGFLAHPNPSFHVSPRFVTSFFHMGACFFNSSMSHSQAMNASLR